MTRGVADRGTERPPRERNVPRGDVRAVVPNRTYNIVGFDIGSADLSKPGIKEQLEPVVQQIQGRTTGQGHHPIVRVTGHASESRLPGKGPEHYARERADAVAAYLQSRGVPRAWIVTDTSRGDASRGAAGRDASPEAKAWARSVTLDIASAREPRDVADRFGDVTYFKGQKRFDVVEEAKDLGKRIGRDLLPVAGEVVEGVGHGIALAGTGLLAAGAVVIGVGGQLVHAGALVEKSLELTVEEVIAIAEQATGRKFGPTAAKRLLSEIREKSEQHHVFVQQLMDWFAEAGINPHEYTVRVKKSVHNWLHSTGWNETLIAFVEQHLSHGRLPTAEEFSRFVWKMMEKWRIDEIELKRHKRLKVPIKK
ncbi:OmpA family protein [Burkholderia ubonensis]|uniref:OmpA family protein n=1 Tax=Burkholderia ubonensis TaxID=101571 RepID=UPI0018DF1C7D|nr:DUF2380 domain-containing protein [Burkholderia ubonensis]